MPAKTVPSRRPDSQGASNAGSRRGANSWVMPYFLLYFPRFVQGDSTDSKFPHYSAPHEVPLRKFRFSPRPVYDRFRSRSSHRLINRVLFFKAQRSAGALGQLAQYEGTDGHAHQSQHFNV